jgi:membrane-bound serine protease (ClpP class)
LVHAATIELLEELGAADRLIAQGRVLDQLRFTDAGRTLVRVGFDRIPSRYRFALPAWARRVDHGGMHVRWAAGALALGALLLAGPTATRASAEASAGRPTVRALELHGAVDPFIAGYLERGIAAANEAGDAAVLVTIDTPGGLDSSMRAIVKAITGSRVPVVCWTGPAGARAASAGTFVMLACPSNAMAHGTNIGAAHPVGVSGAIEQEKVTNDAAAFIRALAEQTHRNANWAESAVRDSATFSAEQAAAAVPPVADRLADSTAALLEDVDGVQVATAAGTVTLHTADAIVQTQDPGLGVALLHGLIDPNLAFVFFYLGLILIVIEVLHPGISVPGVLGTLLLVTSVVAFGILPVQLGGLVLLAASVVLFLVELKHPGVGLPLAGGIACLILGGLLLYDPSTQVHVSRWLVALVTAVLAGFFGFVVKAVLEARALPAPGPNMDELVGARGVALGEVGPRGEVQVGHEQWSAEAAGAAIPAGSRVRVVGRRGLRLIVEPEPTAPRQATERTVRE